jgi:hypothetical protein
MRKNLLAVILICTFSHTLDAQDVEVEFELVYTDDETVVGYPSGFSTWRVFVHLMNADDFLSAVYSVEGQQPLTITSTTQQVWNSGWGAVTTNDINVSTFTDHPEAQYDTWVTIGEEDSSAPGDIFYIAQPSNATMDDYFGTAGLADEVHGDFVMEDGTWFNFNGDVNGVAGDDLKVLVAQITTNGDIEFCASFQVFVHGVSADAEFFDNYCGSALNPIPNVIVDNGENGVTLSPNPVINLSELNFNTQSGIRLVEVRDLMGNLVKSVAQDLDGGVVFSNDDFATGVYLIHLYSASEKVQTLKMLVD